MFFSYVIGQQPIGDNEKCRQIAGDFNCHAGVAVQCGAHRSIEHISIITRSHWMSPSGKCSHCIATAATWLTNSVKNIKR
jgi:hypothetical protein